jgi:hypothetical protein
MNITIVAMAHIPEYSILLGLVVAINVYYTSWLYKTWFFTSKDLNDL